MLRNKLWIAATVIVVLVAGCTGKGKPADSPNAANDRPPLVVPKTFASDKAKMDFAGNAVLTGYYAEAMPLLEQSLTTEPNAVGYVRLGTAKYNMQQYEGAIQAWTKAAELDPTLVGEMRNNSGNALRDWGKVTEAEGAYRAALAVEPTRWNAAVNLAAMLKENGRLPEAIEVLRAAVPANQQVPDLKLLIESYEGLRG